MNEVHLHLILNHLPIAGTFIACILLVYGYRTTNESVISIALYMLMGSAAVSVLVYFTGTQAEDIVRAEAGIDELLVAKHELIGELATYSIAALGLLAYFTLMLRQDQKASAGRMTAIVTVLGMLVMCMMAWAGWSGGRIEHAF